MKARVKATGEIVDVTNLFDDGTAEIGENNYVNYPQAKDLWDSDFIKECLQASLTPSPSV